MGSRSSAGGFSWSGGGIPFSRRRVPLGEREHRGCPQGSPALSSAEVRVGSAVVQRLVVSLAATGGLLYLILSVLVLEGKVRGEKSLFCPNNVVISV